MPDVSLEWMHATPIFEPDAIRGGNLDGIAGKHINSDLQISGVANFHEGHSCRYHRGTFLEYSQDPSVNRGANGNSPVIGVRILRFLGPLSVEKCRPSKFQFVFGDLQREFRNPQFLV